MSRLKTTLEENIHLGFLIFSVGICLLILGQGNAPFPSPDSSGYFSMASRFLEGKGFRNYYTDWRTPIDRKPDLVVHWPPGYPLLLVGIEAFGGDNHYDILWFNTIFFCATLFMTAYFTYTLSTSAARALFAILLVAASYVTVTHIYAWSEPGFTVFLTSGTIFLIRWITCERRRYLVLSGALFGLAWLFRYAGAGIFLPAWCIVVIKTAFKEDKPLTEKLVDIFLFTAIVCLPIGLWILRNVFIRGTLFGSDHQLGKDNPLKNVGRAVLSFRDNFGVGVVGLPLIGFSLLVPYARRVYADQVRPILQSRRVKVLFELFLHPASILLGIAFSYAAFIFIYGLISNIRADIRKFSPVYPLVVSALMALPAHKLVLSKWMRRILLIGLLLLMGLSLVTFRALLPAMLIVSVPIGLVAAHFGLKRLHILIFLSFSFYLSGQIFANVERARLLLNNYDSRYTMPIIQWVQENAVKHVIYTDSFDVLYFQLENLYLKQLPRDAVDIPQLAEFVSENDGYVITFKWHGFGEFVTPEQLLESGEFDVIEVFGDWHVLTTTKLIQGRDPP